MATAASKLRASISPSKGTTRKVTSLRLAAEGLKISAARNFKDIREAVASLEARAKEKNITIPAHRACTGCRGPTKGHGTTPPVGPDCRRTYTESQLGDHLFDRMEVIKMALGGAISASQSQASVSSIHDQEVSTTSLAASSHSASGMSLHADGEVSFRSTSSRKSHKEEVSSALEELSRLKEEKKELEGRNTQMRKRIQAKERRLTEELELTKIESLIVQERASLNESIQENEMLRKDINSFDRKSVPCGSAVPGHDAKLILNLQEQLEALSTKVDGVMHLHTPSKSSPQRKAPTKGALKSGAFDRWEDNVVRKENFPHKFIGSYVNPFDASGKEWDVNNIPLTLFVAGFAKILQSDLALDSTMDREALLQQVATVRDRKLLFLADTMYMAELAGEGGWGGVRKYANRHLRDIESSAEFTWDSYKSNKDMLFMMEQASAKPTTQAPSPAKKFGGRPKSSEGFSPKAASAEMKSLTCRRWNGGTCSSQTDHVTSNILWRHQCDTCLKKGVISSHRSTDPACPNK